MTARVGLTGIEVAVTEPQRPKVGLLGAEVVLSNSQGLNVGFTAVHVLTQLNPASAARLTSVGAEVMVKFGTPTSVITNNNVTVAISGTPDAQLPWMGMETLISVAPAVQANISWMGLEYLVPALPKISIDWLGLEVLVDKDLLDDVPEYLDFGDAFDIYPGQELISYPVTIEGLTDGTIITLYSHVDGLEFSKNGTTFSSTLNVQNDDQVYLKKVLQNIFSTEFLVYVDSSFTGETETGSWRMVGPSQAVKYDQYLYRDSEESQWVEYKITENEESEIIEADFDSVHINSSDSAESKFVGSRSSEYDAPESLFKNQSNEIKDSDAPGSEFKNQSSAIKDTAAPESRFKNQSNEIKMAFAPIALFTDQSNEIKFADAPTSFFGTGKAHYITTIQMQFGFFKNLNNRTVATNSARQRIEAYSYGALHVTEYDKMQYSYHETNPLDAIEGKIAVPLNWRTVAMNFILSHEEEMKLANVHFESEPFTDGKYHSQIPLYWISWQNREIMTQWIFENYNLKSYIDMNWVDLTNKNIITHDMTWIYDRMLHENYFGLVAEYAPWIQGNYFRINLDPYFSHMAKNISYDIAPIFDNYNPRFVNVLYSYESAIDSLKTVDLNAVYENDRIYDSTNYVRQGGYPTFELAEDAASSYPTDITIIYQQPEGTYSYNVLYTNAVWCGDVPPKPALYAVAWYMGGG